MIREMLLEAPRPLEQVRAELLFLDGQYLFHWREGNTHHQKLVSPSAVRQAFSGEPIDSDWIPPGVVRWGDGKQGVFVVKYVPPQKHTLFMAEKSSITVPLPGLVFMGINKTYYLWAIALEEFNPATKIYHAPLPNVHESGLLCFGTNAPPKASCKTIDRAFRMFIEAEFNGHLCNGKSKAFITDVRKQLRSVLRKRLPAYPVADLLPYGMHSVASRVDGVVKGEFNVY